MTTGRGFGGGFPMSATHQTLGDLLEPVGGALLALGLLFLMVGGEAAAVLLVALLIILVLLTVTGAIAGAPERPMVGRFRQRDESGEPVCRRAARSSGLTAPV